MTILILQMKIFAPGHTTECRKRIQIKSWLPSPCLSTLLLLCKYLTCHICYEINKAISCFSLSSRVWLEASSNIKKIELKFSTPILYSLLYSQNRYINLSWELSDYYLSVICDGKMTWSLQSLVCSVEQIRGGGLNTGFWFDDAKLASKLYNLVCALG